VDAHHEIPLVGRHREHHAVAQDARVVDENVKPAKGFQRRRDEPLAGVPVGHVRGAHDRGTARRLDSRCHLLHRVTGKVVEHDIGTAAASPSASARPRPLPAPVTIAVLPSSEMVTSVPRAAQNAAVGDELAAGAIGRLVRGEEGDEPRYLDRLAKRGIGIFATNPTPSRSLNDDAACMAIGVMMPPGWIEFTRMPRARAPARRPW
jgi:hypothetical protein